MWGIVEVSVEQFEVQFTLLEESGDAGRIPFEVVDFLQDFKLEFVVGSDIPGGESPRSGRSGYLQRRWMMR